MAISQPPNQVLTATQDNVVLKINVKGDAILVMVRTVSAVFVEIKLQCCIGASGKCVIPTAQDVSSRQGDKPVYTNIVGRSERRMDDGF
jgi:hypothetical protein